MATLSIKNLPDDLHQRLKERAKQNRRSLNQEAVFALQQALQRTDRVRPDHDALLQQARDVRSKVKGGGLSPEEVRAAINEGRP